jgi:hypothetical protein
LISHLGDRPEGHDPGVGEQEVDAPELRADLTGERLHLSKIANLSLHGQTATTKPLDQSSRLRELLFASHG